MPKYKNTKMLLIYNPKAGKCSIRHSLAEIIELFVKNEYDVIVYPTKGKKDGERMIQERAAEFSILVCCGGDGTLNEVVAGMMKGGHEQSVGYIPVGSTNDFAVSLGISKQIPKAVETVLSGKTRECDIGSFNDEYFVYVAAFGFIADVSYQTDQELKNSIGYTAYLLEAVKQIRNWKDYHLMIKSQEYSAEDDFIFGMITNTNSVGGLHGIVGINNELDDGLFEVMLVKRPYTINEWQEIVSGIITKANNRMIVRFRTSRLEIETTEYVSWSLDGEEGGMHKSVIIQNLNKAFRIFVK